MSTPVSSIRNLGPAVETACAKAGIENAETLRQLGADEAYRRMIAVGTRPHFIGYYVLHMALQGRPWNDCQGDEKKELRRKFDALKSGYKTPPQDAFLAALDAIGVVEKKTS